MAATFKTRVENLVGSAVANAAELDDWLTEAAQLFIQLMRPEDLAAYSTETTLATEPIGQDATNKRILGVTIDAREGIQVHESFATLVGDSNSMWSASPFEPKFYVRAGYLHAYPIGSVRKYRFVGNPTVLNSDVAVASLPTRFERGYVLYAAIQEVIKLLNATLYSAITADFSSVTAPSFASTAAYSYADATGATVASVNTAALGTAPSFTPPSTPTISYTNSQAYISTDEDLEKAGAEVAEIQTRLGDFRNQIENALHTFEAANAAYQAKLATVLRDAEIGSQKALMDAKNSQDLSVINKAKAYEAQVQTFKDNLDKFAAQVKEYDSEITRRVQVYQADVQKASEVGKVRVLALQLLQAQFGEFLQMNFHVAAKESAQ